MAAWATNQQRLRYAAAWSRVGLVVLCSIWGGTVESYPEDTSNRTASGSFLHNGTVPMFERHGFTRSRQIGKHRWVVTSFVS